MGMKTVFQFIMPTVQDISMMKCTMANLAYSGVMGEDICMNFRSFDAHRIYFSLSEIKRYFGGYSCTKAY